MGDEGQLCLGGVGEKLFYSPLFCIEIFWGTLLVFTRAFNDRGGGRVAFIAGAAGRVVPWHQRGLQGVLAMAAEQRAVPVKCCSILFTSIYSGLTDLHSAEPAVGSELNEPMACGTESGGSSKRG